MVLDGAGAARAKPAAGVQPTHRVSPEGPADDGHASVRAGVEGSSVTSAGGIRERLLPALIVLAVLLSTTPMFFAIYRDVAFNTVPHDDYAVSLLSLLGDRGSPPSRQETVLADAPYGYRVLSVAVAIPFYVLLPYYPFSNLEEPDEPYLRAAAALAMVSYLAILLTVLVIYRIARDRLGASRGASLLAAVLGVALMDFVAAVGVDPLAVLVIGLLVYFIDRPSIYVPLIVVSAAINEKILIVFVVLFAARLVAWLIRHRSLRGYGYWPQTAGTAVAVLAYVAMRLVLQLPGGAAHTEPTNWFDQAVSTIAVSLSMKGLVLNGIPLLIVAILVGAAVVVLWRRETWSSLWPSDAIVAPVLLVVGVIIGAEFTVGRLVMYSYPLYLPLLALLLDRVFLESRGSGDSMGITARAGPA